MSYEDRGSGPAVLFLHAFPLSRTMWNRTAEQIAAIARSITMDARGFGESDPAGETLQMESIAEDAAALLDELRIQSVVVCGLSMGGYAAMAFARRFPTRLHGLILSDTRADADTEPARLARYDLIAKIEREGVRALEQAMVGRLLGTTTQRENPELVGWARHAILRVSPEAAIAALRGLAARRDQTDLIVSLDIPILFACGEEDAITPPDEMRALQSRVPRSRFVRIARAGHLANLESPDMFRDAIVDFLGLLNHQRR